MILPFKMTGVREHEGGFSVQVDAARRDPHRLCICSAGDGTVYTETRVDLLDLVAWLETDEGRAAVALARQSAEPAPHMEH